MCPGAHRARHRTVTPERYRDRPLHRRRAAGHGVPAPRRWEEALAAKAEHPERCADRGRHRRDGRDQLRPPPARRLLDLNRIGELHEWATEDGAVRLGAAVRYTRIITELGDRLPGLALASHTVASPQIRNRGSVGGNLGTASPAGDAHPALLAAGAEVEAGVGARHAG